MQVHQFVLIWRLALALGLSSVIGIERETRQKSAGLRTNALVGTGSALFILISEYGFAGVLGPHVTLDPSRVAAQVVSGIGFIGGGLIFVRRSDVRGLTTAAGVWVTAAVGMAAGADLAVLAIFTTLVYLVISYAFPVVERWLPLSRDAPSNLQVTYLDGRGILRRVLAVCAEHGFAVADVDTEHSDPADVDTERSSSAGVDSERSNPAQEDRPTVTLRLKVRGRGALAELAQDLDGIDGVLRVHAGDANGRYAAAAL